VKAVKHDDSVTLEPRKDADLADRILRVGVNEVARRAKVSPTTVSRWRRGMIRLRRSTADRIVAAVK